MATTMMMMHTRALSAAPLRSGVFVNGSSHRVVASTSVVTAMRGARAPLLQQQQALAARRAFSSKSSSSSSSSGSDSFFKRAWARYNMLLETRPLATKMVTGGTIAAIGDINCQMFLEPDKPFDVKRATMFTLIGGVFISPMLHVWFRFLNRVLPGASNLSVAKRLALDQLVFAPTFLPVFFTALLTLEGDVDKVPEKLAEEWWPAVKANWVVWVPAQLINFRFVPGSLQVLFSNVIGLFWNSYLSYISHTDAHVPLDTGSHVALDAAALVHSTEPAATPTTTATPLLSN